MLKTVVLIIVFVDTITIFLCIYIKMYLKIKHSFEIEIFCNIINIFVTFDQFIVSSLNKSIDLF